MAGPHSLEFRANVGLLSRNVVVQGTSPFSQLDKYGAHIKMHSRGDESLTLALTLTLPLPLPLTLTLPLPLTL